MNFLAHVTVSLKPVINDPQGATIAKTLRSIRFEGVEGVRVGKSIEISLNAENADEAGEQVTLMCKKLLANSVLEVFSFEIQPVSRS